MLKRFFVFFTVIAILGISVIAHAQDQEISVWSQAISDAQRDAQASFNERLWYLSGCFFTFGGYFFSHVYYAPVPAVALLGQSPEYVAYYTDTYRKQKRKLRTEAAFNGCVQGAAVQIGLPMFFGLILPVVSR